MNEEGIKSLEASLNQTICQNDYSWLLKEEGDSMKERIETKLNENIERILNKEELLPSDVAILEEKLSKLEYEENKPKQEERLKQMMESIIND